jgi:autotransporter adhesin
VDNAAYGDSAGNNVRGNANIAIGLKAGSGIRASNTVAIGTGSQATKSGSVALGDGSVAKARNVVSVGAPRSERRIINVADAVDSTDAVNLRQLRQMLAAANVSAPSAASAGRPVALLGSVPTRTVAATGRGAARDQQRGANLTGDDGAHPQLASAPSSGSAEESLEPSTIVGWAKVSRDGKLKESRNIVAQTRRAAGEYEIVFKHASLAHCVYNATLHQAGFVSVEVGAQPNILDVETRNHYGVLSDLAFHLMAAC